MYEGKYDGASLRKNPLSVGFESACAYIPKQLIHVPSHLVEPVRFASKMTLPLSLSVCLLGYVMSIHSGSSRARACRWFQARIKNEHT